MFLLIMLKSAAAGFENVTDQIKDDINLKLMAVRLCDCFTNYEEKICL